MPEQDSGSRPDKLGVLGGMGPLATVDFLQKLVSLTPAKVDAGHIPVVVSSEPQIPARARGMLERGAPSPLPALLARRDFLAGAGARAIVMPCNTAHYWFDDLTDGLDTPFLHIVDAVIVALDAGGRHGAKIGLIGTRATIEGRLYEDPLQDKGFECVLPDDEIMTDLVLPGITRVKESRIAEARPMLREAVERLMGAGAEAVVLGCTELPVGLDMAEPWVAECCIDPTEALARACVDWAMAARKKAGMG